MKPKGHKKNCQCVICARPAKRKVRKNHGYENQARVAFRNSTVPLGGTARTARPDRMALPMPVGNPHIQPSGTGNGWTVIVDAHEIPRLRYSAYIGHIDRYGKITLWRPAAGGIPRDYKQHAMRILEEARDSLPTANPAHFPRTARGPKGKTARWFILDLYDGRGAKVGTRIKQGARAKFATEAAGLVDRRVGKKTVRKVELSGPYARKPTASTPRK